MQPFNDNSKMIAIEPTQNELNAKQNKLKKKKSFKEVLQQQMHEQVRISNRNIDRFILNMYGAFKTGIVCVWEPDFSNEFSNIYWLCCATDAMLHLHTQS